MNKDDKIYVAGHRGLVGGAIHNALVADGYTNIVTFTRNRLDLRHQGEVSDMFGATRPDYVFLAAARVGGIHANATRPADFITQNLQIQTNVIQAASDHGVKKLLFLGSSCIYPRLAPQPITEDQLLAGHLEPTNEAYAVAKIAGIVMCQSYTKQHGLNAISLMPTNLYGPRDNFDLETSHVVPALMRKFHEAREGGEVQIWGTGTPRREFLHVDDLADACLFLMDHYESPEPINVGVGQDVPISELAQLMKRVTGSRAKIVYDPSKPDGTPRKLLDISRLTELGWSPKIGLVDGLRQTYEWYRANVAIREGTDRC